ATVPHRRSPGKDARRAPARGPGGDGRRVSRREIRAARHHRAARRRRAAVGEPRLRSGDAQLPRLRIVRHHRARAERLSAQPVARSDRASLLRLSRDGRSRVALHPSHARGGLAAIARHPGTVARAALVVDARHSVSLRGQHRGVAGGRAGPPALAGLRRLAHRRRNLSARHRWRRGLHHARIRRLLRAARHPLSLPRRARDRARTADMIAFWYGALSAMLTTYVVLDGFDFGAGALNLFLARDDRERREILAAIGPVWDGNEVWLIAGGGT